MALKVQDSERAKTLTPSDLDRLSDRVEAGANLAPTPEGKRQALEILADFASREPLVHSLVLKLLKDVAKGYQANQNLLLPSMDDAQVVRHIMWNAGAWQALTDVAVQLEAESLRKMLDVEGNTPPRM